MSEFINQFVIDQAEHRRRMRESFEAKRAIDEQRAEEMQQATGHCQSAMLVVPSKISDEAGFCGATPFEEINGVRMAIRRIQSQDLNPAWGFAIEVEVEGAELSVTYASFDDEMDTILYPELRSVSGHREQPTDAELLQRDKEVVQIAKQLEAVYQDRFGLE